jgi:hypothetical protein
MADTKPIIEATIIEENKVTDILWFCIRIKRST